MPRGTRTGGRAKGTPNKVNAATRERIEAEADPIGFMISVMVKGVIPRPLGYRGKNAGPVIATPEQRIDAAQWLGDKVLPNLKAVELTGAGGGPVTVELVRFADDPPAD